MPNKQALLEFLIHIIPEHDNIYTRFFYVKIFVKAKHHFAFFILIILGGTLLFFSSELFLPDAIKKLVFRSPQIDTIGHFIVFFILTWAVSSILKLSLTASFLTLAFYGALSELGQLYLGFRSAEFSDFFADIAGISLYIFLKYSHLRYKIFTLKRIIQAKKPVSVKLNQ